MAKGLNWEKDRVRREMDEQVHERRWGRYAKSTRDALRGAVMPWGKHRGRRLTAIPRQYLQWLYGVRPEGDWLRKVIGEELFRRDRCERAQRRVGGT